jgi:phosphate transport system substrate-binding protein
MDSVLAGAGAFNVHARQTPSVSVPSDGLCGGIAYAGVAGSGVVASPNGADNGRDALRNAVAGFYPDPSTDGGRGCVDIARSDLGPRAVGPSGDKPSFEYFAFALDAVTWASPSLQAPATMTVQNLRDIYNCAITDWSQLPGGGRGQIQRFMPETASGTRAFFISNVLNGIDPDTIQSGNCPANRDTLEENNGTDLYSPNDVDRTGTNPGLYQNAILPYSAAKFVFQATNSTNPTLDVRGGVRPGGLTENGTSISAVRWTGTAWTLNNATVVGGRTVHDAVTDGGVGSPPPSAIVSSVSANFTATDLGLTVAGTNIPPGATITAVDSPTQIHISIPTVASASGGTLTIGPTVASEKNPNLNTPSDASVYPGVRYIYNVIDNAEPSYVAARNLVGFSDTPSGPTSALCGNDPNTIGVLRANGFLNLPPVTSPGGNPNITCRLQTAPIAAPSAITGMGSPYVSLATQQWVTDARTRGLSVNYLPTSSPEGLTNFRNHLIDFAASEAEYSALDGHPFSPPPAANYQYVPDLASGIAVMYNVDDQAGRQVDYLHLSPRTIARIFTGDISSWRDPAITADNHGLVLPDAPITVAYPNGQSGTTSFFYDFIQHVAPDVFNPWAARNALPTSVRILQLNGGFAPHTIALNGADQLAQFIASLSGKWSIAYDEPLYATTYGATMAWVQNSSGQFVQPVAASITAALRAATQRPDTSEELSAVYNNPDPAAYPISYYSYLVTQCAADASYPTCAGFQNPGVGTTLTQWLRYIACEGQTKMVSIGYAQLPPNLSQEIANAIGRFQGTRPEQLDASNCANPQFTP